jgi:hypothetical protein
VLEADWHDNRPPLAFFCQGGDGRVFIVEPERVGVEEKRLLVGLAFFAEHDVTSYTFVMEGTGSQKMNVLPSEASDRREMLIVGRRMRMGTKLQEPILSSLMPMGSAAWANGPVVFRSTTGSPSFSAQKRERSSRRVGPCEHS